MKKLFSRKQMGEEKSCLKILIALFIAIIGLFTAGNLSFAQTTHMYLFNNTLNEVNGYSSANLTQNLTATCPSNPSAGSFATDNLQIAGSVCATNATVFSFNKYGGLTYPNPSFITSDYTINLFWKFSSVGGGWQRIIDFSNSTADAGIYSYGNGLNFYPNGYVGGYNTFVNGDYYLLSLVRNGSSGIIRVFINGQFLSSYNDGSGYYRLASNTTPLIFFRDNDGSAPCEAQSGNVKYISVKNATSTDQEILDVFNSICGIVTNTPPSISTITNQTTCINSTSSSISFTIGDVETALSNLVMSGSSSDVSLVPNSNFTFSGSSANRGVTITPATGHTGTTHITLTVTDGGGLTTNSSFDLTVVTTPTGQATNVSFSNVTSSKMNITWNNGNGSNRCVFIKEGNTGNAAPVDGTTYTGNTNYGDGTQIDLTGWFCIYNGPNNNVSITGLTPATTYRVMVCENNCNSGNEKYNTNPATNNPNNQLTGPPIFAPTVTTSAVGSITSSSAIGGGNVTSDGGDAITERGVCWGLSVNPVATGSHNTASGTTGQFTANITGLSSNTLYHVRAYAKNSVGTSYGNDITFTTLSNPPVLTFVNDLLYNGNSGVNPTIGTSSQLFRYKVIYTSSDNIPPASGYPQVLIDRNGDAVFNGPGESGNTMTEDDPSDQNYTDGKTYSFITLLSKNQSFGYKFVAQDNNLVSAIGSPINYKSGPVVTDNILDLYIYANDIAFSDAHPSAGEQVTISATIHNQSDYPADNVNVRFYCKNVLIGEFTVAHLSAHTTTSLSMPYIFPNADFFPIKVYIDENNALLEQNRLNNFASRPVVVGNFQLPASIVVTSTLSPSTICPQSWLSISGHADYTGVSDPNKNVSGAEVTIKVVETGAVYTTYTNSNGDYIIYFISPGYLGTFTVTAEVTDFTLTGDAPDKILTIQCPKPPSGPDLAIYYYNISWGSNCISVGDVLNNVTATFANIGNVDATNVTANFYLDGTLIKQTNYLVVAAGQHITETLPVNPFVAPGSHTIEVVLDPLNTVVELNENNNIADNSAYVHPAGPDLTPTDIYFSNYSPDEGDPVNMTFRVDNLDCPVPPQTTAYIYDNYNNVDTQIGTLVVPPVPGTSWLYIYIDNYQFTGVGWHKIKIHVEPVAGEGNILNQDFSKSIYVNPRLPDLKINDIVYENGGYTAYLANTGKAAANNFNVNLYMDNVPFGTTFITTIAAGDVIPVTSALWSYDGVCHTVCAKADESNVVVEKNEYNNNLCKVFGIDLVASFPSYYYSSTKSISVPIGTNVAVDAAISNAGTFTALNVPVTYKIDGVKYDFYRIISLTPGQFYYPNEWYQFNNVGDYVIKIYADMNEIGNGEFNECNENNNIATLNVHVYNNLPDLRVLSYMINPSKLNPDPNEMIDLISSFDNIGIVNSGSFKVRFFVDGVQIGNPVLVNDLAPGANSSVMATAQYSSPDAGAKVIRVSLDDDNSVTEINKLNNMASRAIILGWAPDLAFDSSKTQVSNNGLMLSNMVPKVGDLITVTAFIKNTGKVAADATLNFSVNDGTQPVSINSISISLQAGETKSYQVPWQATVHLGSIIATITNSVPDEYNILNNSAVLPFGGFVTPTVSTIAASSVTTNSAISGGNVTDDGGTTVTGRGICLKTSPNPVKTDNPVTTSGTTGTFSSNIIGLQHGTLYHVRAYATNSVGTAYGDDVTFTTMAVMPVCSTKIISSITTNTAVSGGLILDDGGATITGRGICWNISGTPTTSDSHTSDNAQGYSFTSNITGLTEGTIYHVRAYASNSLGTAYGEDLTFTSLTSCDASVPTTQSTNLDFSDVTQTSATIFWTNGNGSKHILLRKTSPFGSSDCPVDANTYTVGTTFSGMTVVANNSGNSATCSDLIVNSVYYFKVFDYNETSCPHSQKYKVDGSTNSNYLKTAPTQISNLIVRSVSRTLIAIQWSNSSNGDGSMAVCVQGSSGNIVDPIYSTTEYLADNVFGDNRSNYSIIGGPANFVVYKGTSNVISTTGLTKNTQYTFKVYRYNYYNSHYSYATNSTPLSRLTSPKPGIDNEWTDSPNSSSFTVKINPVPANDILNLSLTLNEAANVRVELFNIDGQKVLVPVDNSSYQKGENLIPISIDKLASGSYYLVVSGNNELVIQDFVIVH